MCITWKTLNLSQEAHSHLIRRPAGILKCAALYLLPMLLCITLLVMPKILYAQAFVNGSVSGVVTDPSGAAIPNATVTLKSMGSVLSIANKTENHGLYRIVNVPPGTYRLEVQGKGFKQFVREPIKLDVNSAITVNVPMQIGSSSERVVVTAQASLLQADSSSLGEVIGERPTNDLPLNGRNPIALVALVPGVVTQNQFGQNPVTVNSFASGNFQVNGGSANQNAGYWDGAPMNASGYVNELAILPTQDALQEFKVMTNNLPAEYGRFAGGIVSFITKSGTNQLHGEGYEFIRNRVLNSNDYFSKRYGVPTPQFTQNQFGFNLGGPVVIPHLYNGKNKTFFFFSYDGFRIRQGISDLTTVPTAEERQGDFSNLRDSSGNQIPIYDPSTTQKVGNNYVRQQFTNNTIPTGDLDTAAKVLVNLWAPPNVQGVGPTNANNWFGRISTGGNVDEYIARVDENISDRQHFFVRYALQNQLGLGADPYGTHAGGYAPTTTKNQQAVIDDSYTLSPSSVADIGLTYLRTALAVTPLSAGYDLSQLGPGWASLNSQVTRRALPDLGISDVTGFGGNGVVINTFTDDFGILPNITFIKGRHSVKIGADLRLSRLDYGQIDVPDGSFAFNQGFTSDSPITNVGGSGFASFMLGDAAAGVIQTGYFVAAQQIYRAFYVQDNFKATDRLTINAGLRYSIDGAFSERRNRLSTFDPNIASPLAAPTGLPLKGELVLVDTPQRPSRNGFDTSYKDLAPRIGFGYEITPKTVLRGGYGVFWLPSAVSYVPSNPAADPINQTTTAMVASLDGGITPYNHLENPFPDGILQPPGRNDDINSDFYGGTMYTQYPYNPYAYVQQWNLALEQELPNQLFIGAAYAAAKGTHLPIVLWEQDQLPDSDLALGNSLYDQVPNPFFGTVGAQGVLAGPTVTRGQLLRPYPQYNNFVYGDRDLGNSSYNSLQVKVQKQFHSGQTILLAYTYAKNMNNGAETTTEWLNGVAGIQDFNNLAGEWSASTFDVAQRFVASYVLDLPFGKGRPYLKDAHGITQAIVGGWGIDGIYTYQGGFPLYFTAPNLTGSFGGGSRPNFNTSACPHGAALHGSRASRVNEWFNTSCYAQPAPFTFGDVSRTSSKLRTDAINNLDFAAFKTTQVVPDRASLQFRFEAFNLFNRPQFGYPGMVYGIPGFGTINNQANNPRLIQFGLKLKF